MHRLIETARRLIAWWKGSRPGRALAHYSRTGGSLMAGGLAYSALFSLFATLTIGVSVFSAVLGNNTALRDTVIEQLDSWLPGIIDDGSGTGLLSVDDLQFSAGFGITSLVAFVVLVFSAISFMSALRHGVRTMFATVDIPENVALAKLRDLGGFVAIALALLLSSASSLVVSGALGWFFDLLGLDHTGFASGVVRVATAVVAFVIDAAMVACLFVILGRARPSRRDLAIGCGGAAAALTVLRLAGVGVIASGKSNALLASFMVIVTLLVWVNVLARVLLVAASWTADPPQEPDLPAPAPIEIPALERAAADLRARRTKPRRSHSRGSGSQATRPRDPEPPSSS